ncbi:conserved Plasmodium protein, unknown function [Plasmodium gallinaceum]|uniref:Pseudouridine synthase n=1 Tax=Plasmodium gallinaceum TaxID=5849 RepID=A0A1J1GPF7_PLAGA|nr:conserved Plasmodium protein, unknown function [Plasmodium gallinaceum]CRG94322.1 conserved Plasmodium protein, unknown function [Plasmodium gallinaceum]
MLKNLFKLNTLRRISSTKYSFNINELIIYNDDDYIVVNKNYGVSTFGKSEKKESIKKNLHNLNLENIENVNIVYKLHNTISGCILICKNKFLKTHNYENMFITLVYGKIEKKNNGEIKLHLKYLPNSNIMIPSNNYEHINDLKMLKYDIISNTISYNAHDFTILKIYINANNCKYIKPLLFYSLYTCIVGDNEYINIHKKLKKEFFFFQHIRNIKNSKKFLLKKLNDKNENKENQELKLHLHCSNVTFQSTCNKIISVSSPLPVHIKETLKLLGSTNLIEKLDKKDQNDIFTNKLDKKKISKNILGDEIFLQNSREFNQEKNENFYDALEDEDNLQKENDELLNEIYKDKDKKKKEKQKIKRGVLAKDFNKLTSSDAPIFFTDVK